MRFPPTSKRPYDVQRRSYQMPVENISLKPISIQLVEAIRASGSKGRNDGREFHTTDRKWPGHTMGVADGSPDLAIYLHDQGLNLPTFVEPPALGKGVALPF